MDHFLFENKNLVFVSVKVKDKQLKNLIEVHKHIDNIGSCSA